MTDLFKIEKKLKELRAEGNKQKYWDYYAVEDDIKYESHLLDALIEEWYGYVLECLGEECCRVTGTLMGVHTASNTNFTEWHERNLLPQGDISVVHQVRTTRSVRSLKNIARWMLKRDLTGHRDCATNGLKLVRKATHRDDAVLGYSLIGLAVSELPVATSCQFSFCFRDVPVPHDRKLRKFCDAHATGSAGYVRARFFERRLNEGNGLNPKQSSWGTEEIRGNIEDILYPDRGKDVADIDPLPNKLHTAKSRVVREMKRAQYENLGLIEPPTQKDWRVVAQEWCRMYPWLPQTILTSRSWPSVVDTLQIVLNDRHCGSHSTKLWDAKIQNHHWERELIYSYDCRRRPSPLSDQIIRLGRMGLRQNVIASQLGISADTVSQCIKRETERNPMRYPELQKLRRPIVCKSGIITESK